MSDRQSMDHENKLFHQIKKGDEKSFELLFKTYYAPLCLFATKYTKNEKDSEEIVQNFFVKLWEKKSQININTSLKSYLFSAVRNHCFNHLKHQKIKLNYQTDLFNTLNHEIKTDQYFMEIGLMKKIDSCIQALPKRRREIFLLSREQGLKYREIADQLGLSIKTVEAQMGHALKELRKQLKDYKQIFISIILFHKPLK
jgi:RNA polymerase sigma-70 factor (ECF subfamily)